MREGTRRYFEDGEDGRDKDVMRGRCGPAEVLREQLADLDSFPRNFLSPSSSLQNSPLLVFGSVQQILSGQKVTVVRCEDINVSGSFFRNKLKYHAYLHSASIHFFIWLLKLMGAERHIVNPKKSGPFHERAPSRILYKAIRGMVSHFVWQNMRRWLTHY